MGKLGELNTRLVQDTFSTQVFDEAGTKFFNHNPQAMAFLTLYQENLAVLFRGYII